MSFLKNIFGKKDDSKISTNEDFWNWFSANEKDFEKKKKTPIFNWRFLYIQIKFNLKYSLARFNI